MSRSAKLMQIVRSLIVVLFFVFTASLCAAKTERGVPLDGTYIGRQKYVIPGWYHENKLFIRNGEAILDKVPIHIKRGKTFYSASDGGFYTYRAKFTNKGGKSFVTMRLFRSDYIPHPVGHDIYSDIKAYPVKVMAGDIISEGTRYKSFVMDEREKTSYASLLDKVLLEKPLKSDSY